MKLPLTLIAILSFASTSFAQNCQTGKLDPRVAQALKVTLTDLPSSPTASLEQIRDVKMEVPKFPSADVQHLKVTADSIPIQVHNPAHVAGLPIIISYHPGGFVTPILPFMEYEFWRQAKTYNAIVFGIDYRVAPENKYPAAVNDAYNAFRWIADHGHIYGGDTSRIIVLGVSAGGNLAAVVSQKAKADGMTSKIKLQVLNCPSTDNPKNSFKYPSYQHYESGYFLSKAFCQYYIQAYAPEEDVHNPEIGPINAKSLSGLPPAVIITAEFDPLRDEGFAYAQRLEKAGVKLWHKCFRGQIHCLVGLPPDAEELKEADRLVINAMETVLEAR